jgi:hypothetical protein
MKATSGGDFEMRKAILGAAVAAMVVTGAAVAFKSTQHAVASKNAFTLRDAAQLDFPVYYAGDSVDGLPLVAQFQERVPTGPPSAAILKSPAGQPDPRSYAQAVVFIYGKCEGLRCYPPAQIQVYPACARNLSLYSRYGGPGAPQPQSTQVRGAPAAWVNDRLEIQTGISTIVVFGDTPGRVERVSDELRGLNVPVQAHDQLPPAAEGATEGRLVCS